MKLPLLLTSFLLLMLSCKTKNNIVEPHLVDIHIRKDLAPQDIITEFDRFKLQLKGFSSRKENRWVFYYNQDSDSEKLLIELKKSTSVINAFLIVETEETVKSGKSGKKGTVRIK